MKPDLSRRVPPGFPLGSEFKSYVFCLVFAVLYSFSFLIRFFGARGDLYYSDHTGRHLWPGAIMPDFAALFDGALAGVAFAVLCAAGFAVYHYLYHRQGSKSIYLMRRLPDRTVLHRRCLTLPLYFAAVCAVLAALLLVLYFVLYMLATPAQCLTPDQWQKIWR